MNTNLTYDGKKLSSFGIRTICLDPFTVPAPDMETTHVDGLDGDLHFYYNSHQNVTLSYLCIISKAFRQRYAAFRSWICSKKGYKRLEDAVYPDEFRMAAFSDIKTKSNSKDPNSFELEFSCKPQRFLKSGELVQTFNTSGTIQNPTEFESKPFIRVYGTGQFGIGEEAITVTSNDGYTDIDCELQDAYHEAENRNGNIQLLNGIFPVLRPGKNDIKLTSGIRIEIRGRWFDK